MGCVYTQLTGCDSTTAKRERERKKRAELVRTERLLACIKGIPSDVSATRKSRLETRWHRIARRRRLKQAAAYYIQPYPHSIVDIRDDRITKREYIVEDRIEAGGED